MIKKTTNQFASIIAARQEETANEPVIIPTLHPRREKASKRGNPDYSPVTVYIPIETYARAQFEMTRRGRKREMSELFTELLDEWLKQQG